MNARFRVAVLAALFVLGSFILLGGAAGPPAMGADGVHMAVPHITVTGRARQDVVPDLATLSLAVVTERPKAADAEAANTASVQALIQTLTAQGVAAGDIKTVSLTLAPVYSEQRDLVRNVVNRVLRGYRATHGLTVKVHDIAKAGALARQMIGAGANAFYGVRFDYAEKEKVLDRLRGEAVLDALRKAKAYLAPLGLSLGRVTEIVPNEAAAPNFRYASHAMLTAEPAASIPIEPGTQKLETEVQVTWEITP